MKQKVLQNVKGMYDILPDRSKAWQFVEMHWQKLMSHYGYHEIRTPILEFIELFKRGVGDTTDIVEKEMFSFKDRGREEVHLGLRPEGTASCVRAAIQNGLLNQGIQRLWYEGAMFRHENVQKGRHRQFHQFGVEVFGIEDEYIEAEHIVLMSKFWKALGLSDDIELEINTIGTLDERLQYRQNLKEYFQKHFDALDADSQKRLDKNPLRILDSKNPQLNHLIQSAPSFTEYLSDASLSNFECFKNLLSKEGIPFTVNERLVRGLDYYNNIVYEWVTDKIGAQATVCAGGRYDSLTVQLGGKMTPAVGFAVGIERVLLLLSEEQYQDFRALDSFLICMGDEAQKDYFALSERIRTLCPHIHMQCNYSQGNFKNQLKKADKSGAHVAFIIADQEYMNKSLTIKYLREEKPQETISLDELSVWFKAYREVVPTMETVI